MVYKAFIFDFDGVLADSVEVKTKAFAKLFEKYGVEIQNKVIDHHRHHGGMTRVEKFKWYFKEFLKRPLDKDGLQTLCDEFSEIVVDQVVASPEIDGAEAFLEKHCQQLHCFVDSATPDVEIQEIVKRRGWSKYFIEVLGSDQSKTENLKYILGKYNISPDTAVFFGDATGDYQAATNCGVDFYAVVPDVNAPLLEYKKDLVWVKNFLEVEKRGYFEV